MRCGGGERRALPLPGSVSSGHGRRPARTVPTRRSGDDAEGQTPLPPPERPWKTGRGQPECFTTGSRAPVRHEGGPTFERGERRANGFDRSRRGRGDREAHGPGLLLGGRRRASACEAPAAERRGVRLIGKRPSDRRSPGMDPGPHVRSKCR